VGFSREDARWPYGPEVYAAFIDDGDTYLPGLQALAMSLVLSGTSRPLVVIVTGQPSAALRAMAVCLNVTLVQMEPIANPYHRTLWTRRYTRVFSKLNIWRLPARRVIYLDSDTIVLKNIDELFAPGPEFMAAEDCPLVCLHHFNAGMMVIRPSNATFQDMLAKVGRVADFDDGDQGFLSEYFGEAWAGDARLDGKYNTICWNLRRPGVKLSEVKVIHNTGYPKPWTNKSEWSLKDKFKNPTHWLTSIIEKRVCRRATDLYWQTMGAYSRRCGAGVRRP